MTSRKPSRRRAAGKTSARRRSVRGGFRPFRRDPPDEFLRFHGPGGAYLEGIALMAMFSLMVAALPFVALALVEASAIEGVVRARRAFYRRRARIDRTFAKQCVERLRDLKGSSGAVYRRALRELVAERIRLEDEQAAQALADQPGAAAHRAAGRSRREKAGNKWFKSVEREIAERGEPGESLCRAPGRRGAPIRRLCERSVIAPPTADDLRAQWEKARGRGRVEEKIRLGSMLLDAEATVDSSLVRDRDGEIVGRRGGLREWIDATCPDLSRHYAALMGYRRMAADFRREHGLGDPAPAALLLAEAPETEKKLPPAQRATLSAARAKAQKLLVSAELTTAKAFRARLLAMRDARTVPLAGTARRLA